MSHPREIYFDDAWASQINSLLPTHWTHGEYSEGHVFYWDTETTHTITNVSYFGGDPNTCRLAQAIPDSLGNYYKPAFYHNGEFIGNYTRKISYFPDIADSQIDWAGIKNAIINGPYTYILDNGTSASWDTRIRYPYIVAPNGEVYTPFDQTQPEVIDFAKNSISSLTVKDSQGAEYTTYKGELFYSYSFALAPTDPTYPVYLLSTSDGGILLDDAPVTATTAASLGYTISNGRAYLI